MRIFEFTGYKEFVNAWIRARANGGRGEFQKVARHLSIHPTLVSHIFRGAKDLSMEQAGLLCKYLQLSNLETDYFLLLVQRSKSGSVELSRILDRQISDTRKKARDLVNRVQRETELSDEDKAVFYSNWYYSAVRLLTSIEGFQTKEALQAQLRLPSALLQDVLDFLVQRSLVRFDGKNYSLGPAITHLERSSKHVSKHHVNWRLKAIENHPLLSDEDLVFSAPLTISKKDAALVQEKLTQFIQELGTRVKESSPEQLRCLNIDWVTIAASPKK